jgi:excisionase family DNA binding protein
MELYTVADIMRILRISKNLAYSLVVSDGFPSIKIGRTYRIPKKEFEVWCARHIGKEVKI